MDGWSRTKPKVGWWVGSSLRARRKPEARAGGGRAPVDRLDAVGDLELAEHAVGMGLDRADGDQQRSRDFRFGRAAREQV